MIDDFLFYVLTFVSLTPRGGVGPSCAFVFYHDDTPFCSFVHVHFSMMERILHGMALGLSYESSLNSRFPSTGLTSKLSKVDAISM